MDENNNNRERRRGRPAGKNRKPLSLEERRARNAQYERERREAAAQALALLTEALGCSPNTTYKEVLATAIAYINHCMRLDPADDIETLQQQNERLLALIAEVEERVAELPNTSTEDPSILQSVMEDIYQESDSSEDEDDDVEMVEPSTLTINGSCSRIMTRQWTKNTQPEQKSVKVQLTKPPVEVEEQNITQHMPYHCTYDQKAEVEEEVEEDVEEGTEGEEETDDEMEKEGEINDVTEPEYVEEVDMEAEEEAELETEVESEVVEELEAEEAAVEASEFISEQVSVASTPTVPDNRDSPTLHSIYFSQTEKEMLVECGFRDVLEELGHVL